VGGGSTANLLAVWRVHGLDKVLERAWHRGTVLCGVSAGMNCWFSASVTDSFGPSELTGLQDGLGLIPASSCPHYDGDEKRRPTYRRLVAAGELPAGWAAEDGAALIFEGQKLKEVVATRPEAKAYRVQLESDGSLKELPIEARFLGS
jgi:peptidase E